jgi:hypothetical protein
MKQKNSSGAITTDMQAINKFYRNIKMKAAEMILGLSHRIFTLDSGWYSDHLIKRLDNHYQIACYLIMVISVDGLCKLEVNETSVSILSKLRRVVALQYTFEKFSGVSFSAYDVKDTYTELFHSSADIAELHQKVLLTAILAKSSSAFHFYITK